MTVPQPAQERWKQAALWREALVPHLERAADALREAHAGAPTSTERLHIERALTSTMLALADARLSAAECHRRLEKAA